MVSEDAVSIASHRALFSDLNETLDSMQFTVFHRIVTGSLLLGLEQQLDLHPELIDVADFYGRTPLFWAARRCDFDMTSLLIQSRADIDLRDLDGYTAAHEAAYAGSVPCLKALLDAGASIDATSLERGYEITPLTRAVRSGNPEVAFWLLKRGADPNLGGYHPLAAAAEDGISETVEMLLDHGAEIDQQTRPANKTALMRAICYDRTECCQILCNRGARLDSVNIYGESVLHYAAIGASTATMDVLTKACIQGLQVEADEIEVLWEKFENHRDPRLSKVEAIEEARAAFQRLLNSIRPWSDDDGEDEDDEHHDESHKQAEAKQMPAFPTLVENLCPINESVDALGNQRLGLASPTRPGHEW